MPELDQWVGLGVTVVGGAAGIWLIVKWLQTGITGLSRYQRDIASVYKTDLLEARLEIERLEKHSDYLDNETDELTASLRACQMERAAMRAFIIEKGLTWNPIDWGLHDRP